MVDVRCVEVNRGKEKLQCHEGKRAHYMGREKGQRGLRECGVQFTQEENLSGPETEE